MSGAYSLSRFESGFLGPLEGYLIQRFGSRMVMAVGFVSFGLGFLLLSRVNSIFSFYLAFLMLSLGSSFGGWSPITASINNWFRRHRTKAIGSAMLGLGLGGVALSPVVAYLIDNYGWENTALLSGVIVVVVGIPLSRLVRFSPEPYGYLPDGDFYRPQVRGSPGLPQLTPNDRKPVSEAEYDFTVKEALKSSAFWVMSIGHAVALLSISALGLHLVAYLQAELDFSTGEAAKVVMVLTGFNMVGQPLGGVLGDRYPKKYIAFFTLVGHCIGLLLLATADSFLDIMVGVIIQGAAWGIRGPVLTSMRGEFFGRKSFPMIMGFSNTIMMVGMIIGPLVAGFMADQYSYRSGFLIIAAVVGMGSFLFLFLKKPCPPATG